MHGQPGHYIWPHTWLLPSFLGMAAWMTSQLNIVLIRKLRRSLISLHHVKSQYIWKRCYCKKNGYSFRHYRHEWINFIWDFAYITKISVKDYIFSCTKDMKLIENLVKMKIGNMFILERSPKMSHFWGHNRHIKGLKWKLVICLW